MKTLHKFTVSVPKNVEKTETFIRDGKEVKETQTVTENVDHIFIMKQMSRTETDSARLFNGASLKRAIDAGLITNAVLVQKHIDGNGSLISKDTAKRIVDLNQEIQSLKDEIISLGITEKDENKKSRQAELLAEFEELTRELRAIEGSNQAVFGSTAEKYANERSNLWIMLNQTYIEKNGKPEPFFKGDKFEDKEKFLEQLEESEDPLYTAAVEKLSVFWGYYLSGLITTPEQFQNLEKQLKEESESAVETKDDIKEVAAVEPVAATT
jgi:6-pyruvoyl-tetrahydropterin synthase